MSVKSIYNFLVAYQSLTMLIFFYFFFENNLSVQIPLYINLEIIEGTAFVIDYLIDFNIISMVGFITVVAVVTIASGVNVAASGLNETATENVKGIISVIALSTIMGFPTYFLFGLSEYLINYAFLFNFCAFVIYVMNYLSNREGGNE